jgi:hypothetical protein
MKIAVRHAGVDLGFVERTPKTIDSPRPPLTAREDCRRSLWNARENVAQRAVKRNDCLAAVATFASGQHDRFVADVRPGNAHEIAQAQTCVAGEVDGMSNLHRAGLLDVRYIGLDPDDLRSIVVVEPLDSLAGITGN